MLHILLGKCFWKEEGGVVARRTCHSISFPHLYKPAARYVAVHICFNGVVECAPLGKPFQTSAGPPSPLRGVLSEKSIHRRQFGAYTFQKTYYQTYGTTWCREKGSEEIKCFCWKRLMSRRKVECWKGGVEGLKMYDKWEPREGFYTSTAHFHLEEFTHYSFFSLLTAEC